MKSLSSYNDEPDTVDWEFFRNFYLHTYLTDVTKNNRIKDLVFKGKFQATFYLNWTNISKNL